MNKKNVMMFLLGILFCVMINCIDAKADGYEINDISITVKLNEDGSANIKEVWDVYAGEGTEWYLVQGNLGKIKIKDFSVKDETGKKYKNIGKWDVDKDLDEKAGKCGIVDKGDGNYELCFGIGSYDNHTFTITYKMTNFVKRFDDYCGFNQRLINDSLSANPKHVAVTISKKDTKFNEDDVQMWAFGFKGDINLKNGKIYASSDGTLESDDYVTIMCSFPKKMFDTNNVYEGSFDEMKNKALEADELSKDDEDYLIYLIIFIGVIVLFFAVMYKLSSKLFMSDKKPCEFEKFRDKEINLKSRKFYKRYDILTIGAVLLVFGPIVSIIGVILMLICRSEEIETDKTITGMAYPAKWAGKEMDKYKKINYQVPHDMSIPQMYYMISLSTKKKINNRLIGAYIFKWIREGKVRIDKDITLKNYSAKDFKDKCEYDLYVWMKDASGDDDVLTKKEIKNYAKYNYDELNSVLAQIMKDGEKSLIKNGMIAPIYCKYFFVLSKKSFAFSETGIEKLKQLFGIRNYLKNIASENDNYSDALAYMDSLMVIAQLFDISNQAIKGFESVKPGYVNQYYYIGNDRDMYDVTYMVSGISRAGIKGMDSASSGDGGSSYSDGGSGSSGGGSGGGGR